jgi:hypothetical protein
MIPHRIVALADADANLDPHRVPTGHRDWHAQRSPSEPRCGADQWRTRDREVIAYMHEMEDRHLGHCIRFASTKPQHASRLSSLLAERA